MAFSRPPNAPPTEKWSLYRAPDREGRPRRRRTRVLNVLLVGAVAIALLMWRNSWSAAPRRPTPASAAAQQYGQLADRTIQLCSPAGTTASAFSACLQQFQDGLGRLALPASSKRSLDALITAAQLAQTCTAGPSHDDPAKREWPVGCPQKGPTSPEDADAQDRQTRADLYQSMLQDDDAVRQILGLAPPSPLRSTTTSLPELETRAPG